MRIAIQILLGALLGSALALVFIWAMTEAVQSHFDRKRERAAEELIQADLPAIHAWKIRVTHNIDARRYRGKRANLAHLRIERVRRTA